MMHQAPVHAEVAKRRGTSVTELAVVLPIVLVFVFGAIDFAQVMFAYGTVSEAARAGARYAITHGAASSLPAGPSANDANVQAVVRFYAFGLKSSNVTVTSSWALSTNAVGSPVNVTASYPCQLSVGRLVGMNSFTVKGSSTMMIAH